MYVFGDTETTGLGSDAGIVEISWIETDENFNEISRFSSLINPQKPIQHGAMGVHGITQDMVTNAPTIEEFMAASAYPLIGGRKVLVAHNCSFDIKFFAPWMDEPESLCTLKCARNIYPDADNHKLGTLKFYLGLEGNHTKAHSAQEDVYVLIQLAKRMCQDAGTDLAGLMEIQNIVKPVTKIGFGKHRGALLKDLPKDYVNWLLTKCDNVKDDLRAALQAL